MQKKELFILTHTIQIVTALATSIVQTRRIINETRKQGKPLKRMFKIGGAVASVGTVVILIRMKMESNKLKDLIRRY
jgi:hypothetical protein